MRTSYDYLIVGGGMVADAAARGIRELDARGTIGILSADIDPPYTRPALTKKLWTDPSFTWDQVPLGTTEATGAELTLRTEVTGIDRDDRSVATAAGDVVGYGRLLLATGGTPQGIDLPEDDRVIRFRSADDYRRLRDLAGGGRHIAVVGGSYIATELAAALVRNDTRVTLVYPQDVLGGATFPPGLAAGFEQLYRDAGVALLPGHHAPGGTLTADQVVLNLDDGSELAADAVVLGLGISPVTGIAEEAGLEVEDGVVVDAHLRTADEAIFAAGDIAQYPDRILGTVRVEHVDNARAMGRAAGRAMAGDTHPYDHTPYFYSDVFGQHYDAVGQIDASLETLEDWIDPDAEAVAGQPGVVYYLQGEAPIGVLLWNVPEQTDAARGVLASPPASREELVGRIRP